MSKLVFFVVFCVFFVVMVSSGRVQKVREERCLLPIKRGTCTDFYTRYAYDPAVNKCVRFKYGGCGGNSNNFRYHYDCRHACII